jgi:hypothetical protein
MITIRISMSRVDPPHCPAPPPGSTTSARSCQLVPERHGLSPNQSPDAVLRAPASETNDLFDVMITCLESALVT